MSELRTGQRLLALKEIFLQKTDEGNQLSIDELIEKLKIEIPDCSADKRAVKRYIDTLRDAGFDIIENIDKYGKKLYSHQARLFETYQLRLIVDPILSARFITTEEKKNIINNVKKLTSEYIAKTIPDPIIYEQSINRDYQRIKQHIDTIHEALSQGKIICFKYGDVNIKKEFTLRKDGATYHIKPYNLISESNFYYLIGEDINQSSNPRNYRLDRMRDVIITDEKFVKKPLDLSAHVRNSFHMFGGEDEWIKLQFVHDNAVLNGVIDKFGTDAEIRESLNNTFILNAKAKLSEGLKAWILSWGSKVRVMSPKTLKNDIHNELKKMLEQIE